MTPPKDRNSMGFVAYVSWPSLFPRKAARRSGGRASSTPVSR
ncbi:hypothetical protein [Rhodobacter capsulatus]